MIYAPIENRTRGFVRVRQADLAQRERREQHVSPISQWYDLLTMSGMKQPQ